MAKTAAINLELREGATYRRTLRWVDPKKKPINLTGAVVTAEIRDRPDGTLLWRMTAENGCIEVLPTLGTVKMHLTPAQTQTFTFQRAVWDLKVAWANGDVDYPVTGKVTVLRSVTE